MSRDEIGHDVRRGWTAEDRARAEGLVARHGGMLSAYSGHGAGVSVEWIEQGGERVSIEGHNAADVLAVLSTVLDGEGRPARSRVTHLGG